MRCTISRFITILLLFITSKTFAQQTGSLTGTVSLPDGKPAIAITVTIPSINKGAVTNEDGRYTLEHVPAGGYILRFTGVGVVPAERRINIHPNKTASLNVELEPKAGQLQGISITENRSRYKAEQPSSSLRLSEPLQEIPQNVQIITAHAILDQQMLTMGDGVNKLVSGATRIEHWADLYARINARGDRVGAFRNGVNVTSDWGPLSEDMSMVDHIEFVKGPAGFMMSNGDPAGLYNVVTKKPTGNGFNGEASVTMGSFDLYRASVDLDGKVNKNNTILYRLNVMGQNKNSFRPNEFSNRWLVDPVLTFKLDDNTTLTAEYTYQHVKMSDPGTVYSFSTEGYAKLPRNFTLVSAGLDPTFIDDHSAFLNLQHHLNDRWKFTAQVAYFNYTQTGANVWPDQVNADGTIIRGDGIWDSHSEYKFAQAYFNGEEQTGSIHHRILGGLDLGTKNFLADFAQYYTLDSAGAEFDSYHPDYYSAPVNGFPVWDRSKPIAQRPGVYYTNQSYSGLYLQDELGFFKNRLRLTLAGRYTYVKQDEGGPAYDARKFTPRVGLSVTIKPEFSAYALFDQSFIPQTGIRRDGGPIKPKEGNNLEIGLKKDWFNARWSTTVSAYRTLKNNATTSDPTNSGAESFVVVLGQTQTKGIEFDLRGELLPGLNLLANYAYTDARVNKATPDFPDAQVGDRVPGYATHDANAWLSYKQNKGILKGLGISGGVTYLNGRDSWNWANPTKNIAALPDYFRLDGSVFYEKRKIRFSVNVYNILNTYLYSGNWEDWAGYYSWQTEAGTNYRFNVSYRF